VQKVTGIGGVFFRSDDPEKLSSWYEKHLGIDPAPPSYDVSSWWQQAGPTVFTAMESSSGHFGRPEQQWAVNFRVADLDAMVEQLRGAGIEVTVDGETYPNGRFADLRDPDGNPVQLWEPAGADARGPDGP
jgi:predicted enzyme related to lactoylglutathione lyase